MWRRREWFEVVHRIAPLVRDDGVQFRMDSFLRVFVETVEVSVGCIS